MSEMPEQGTKGLEQADASLFANIVIRLRDVKRDDAVFVPRKRRWTSGRFAEETKL
jgi:hypothetical protein